MNNRKLRFNAIDALIILIIIAVVGVLLYVFVLHGNNNVDNAVSYKTITYTIDINNVEERFANCVRIGQTVQDEIEHRNMGTITGVQISQYKKNSFNYEDLTETVAEVEGRVGIKLTIEALAEDTEQAYKVDGCEIRVGQMYSLSLPEIYLVGYCVFIDDNVQK